MTIRDLGIIPIPFVFTLVLIIYLVLVMYLGKISYDRSKSLNEFFVMGGAAGMIMGGIGYFATQYSMSTFQGVPGTIYTVGWPGLAVSVPTASFSLLVPAFLVGSKLMKLGHKYGYLTMADYLEDRFQSKALRGLSALFTLLFLIPFLGAQTIGAGAIVNTFTGAPFWVGVVIMGIGVTIYCGLGGIRGAMYTNILQGILMVITAISLFFAAIHLGGGLSAVNQRLLAADAGAFRFPGSPNAWLVYGNYFSQLVLWNFFTIGQPQLATKFFLMKNNKALYGSMIAAGVGMFLSTFFIYSTGVIARDVLPGVPRNLIDWVVPAIAAKTTTSRLASILMGGILAAGMSTIDSVVVVVGGALSRDIYQKLINPKASDEDVLKLSRICVVLVGCLATLLGIARPASIFQIVLFTFAGLGIQAIVMILGVRWKRANWQGATAGLLVGLISVIYFATHPQILPGWNAALPGGLACLIVMVIVSLLTSPTPEDVIKRHFTL